MSFSGHKFASFLQFLVFLLMILSVLDFFYSGYYPSSSKYGLYINFFLFNSHNVPAFFTFTDIPLWGVFQFFMYCLLIIGFLELLKVYRSERDSRIRALKFNAIFSLIIFVFAIGGALILSYSGLAAHGQYTLSLDNVRFVIGLFIIIILFSLVTIFKSLTSH